MKLNKKIIKSLFVAAFVSQSASANTDIDLNDDGLVDEEHYSTNLLLNADFTQSGESWEVSDLEFHLLESRNGAESTMLGSTNSHRVSYGSATQVITLADAGFSDTESLDNVLSANHMKVVFGAWHATSNMNNTLTEITLTFLDEDGAAIGSPEVLSKAGTLDYAWQRREGEAVIPSGTRAISYKVELYEPGSTGVWNRVDDAYLHIQLAEDDDLDSVLDYNDVDKDNDGIVDEDSYATNLLSNDDFTNVGESWEVSDLEFHLLESRNGAESTMLGSTNSHRVSYGSATQVITLADAGFSDTESLDNVLSANHMKVVFGAWHATSNMNNTLTEITLTFLDEDGAAIGSPEVLSKAGTLDYAWQRREGEAVIPSGTRAISYKVELYEPGSTGVWNRIDDAFINIHDISDPDNDGLGYTAEINEGTDPNDADTDNDGIPDGVEYLNGLNPLNRRDGDLDQDEDGFSNFEEFSLGTDINADDTDGDGIPDRSDNFPTQPNAIVSGLIDVVDLGDVDNDLVNDYAVIESDDEGNISAALVSGGDIYSLPEQTAHWANKYQSTQVIVLDDMTGNGVPDIGVFGVIEQHDEFDNISLKPQLEVRDPVDGSVVKFNWPSNWVEARVKQLDDLNGNGHKEVALEGRFLVDGLRPQLIVRDGFSREKIATYSFPNLFSAPQWHQHSDMNGDGVGDISLSGKLFKNSKTQIKVLNAKVADERLYSYNFPDKWDAVSWNRLADINGDEVTDWGMLGTSKEDGRIQLFTKSGNEIRGTLGIFAWPEGMQNVQLEVVEDLNFDGISELMLSGFRTDVQRHQISVKSGTDRNEQLLRLTWANNYSEVSYHVLNNMNGDGMASFALLGKNERSNQYVLSIAQVDTALSSETTQINLGANWSEPPTIKLLDDDNNDGKKELLFIGKDSSNELRLRKVSSSY